MPAIPARRTGKKIAGQPGLPGKNDPVSKTEKTEKGNERQKRKKKWCIPLTLVLGRWSRRIKYLRLATCPFQDQPGLYA